MPPSTENITVRMQPKTSKRLEAIAAREDRSRNWLINQAIEDYLDLYEWQAEKIRQRLARAEKGGKFKSGKEVDKLIEKFKP